MARQPILPDEDGNYTEKQLEKLKKRALNSALWHIQQSPKTVAEIRKKLTRKLIPDDIIEDTINRLVEADWLNDSEYAEQFVYSKRTYDKLGAQAIRQKLMMKGIPQEIIMEQLEALEEDDLRESAKQLAEKKMRSLKKEPDKYKRAQKIVQHLAYKGYNIGLAYQVAQEVVEEHMADFEEEFSEEIQPDDTLENF